jgi:pullulanase/glycogen debranching enzyme
MKKFPDESRVCQVVRKRMGDADASSSGLPIETKLLFFDSEDDARPERSVSLDPAVDGTYHYWHTFVPGVEPGQIYGYRVRGPFDPSRGMRFDPTKILLDPYACGVVVPRSYSRDAVRKAGDNTATAPLYSRVVRIEWLHFPI